MKAIKRSMSLSIVVLLLLAHVTYAQSFLLQLFQKPSTPAEWEKQALDSMEIVAENEFLELYFNKETTEIAVRVKATDHYWFSNPVDREKNSGLIFEEQSAQFAIYHDPSQKEKQNYRFGVKYGQFEYEPLENGLRINYQIVEEWGVNEYVPRLISYDRFQDILNKIDKQSDKKFVADQYDLILLKAVKEDEEIRLSGLNHDALFNGYGLFPLDDSYKKAEAEREQLTAELDELKSQIASSANHSEIQALEAKLTAANNKLFDRRRDLTWHLLNTVLRNRLDIERMEDIRFADISQLVDTPTYLLKDIPRFQLEDMVEIIRAVGYDPHEVAADHRANNLDPTIPHLEEFTIPLEYYLDGDSLVVKIPVDEIYYPIGVTDTIGRKYTFPITDIDVLKYFGAAAPDHEGYIFVPDGSGALIDFNNQRDYSTFYREKVYGFDYSSADVISTSINELIYMPVFGMKADDDNAFVAIIESGSSMATINADFARRNHAYNTVYASFKLLPSERLDIGRTTISKYQPRFTDCDIVIRYAFLTDDDADYSGMARRYQQHLINEYGFPTNKVDAEIPLYLDILAAVPIEKPVLGFPRTITKPLSTFKQTQLIVAELLEKGVANIELRYRGWNDGGIERSFMRDLRLERTLGSSEDFSSLVAYLEENNVGFYPEISVANASLDDSAFSNSKAARTISGSVAKVDRRTVVVSPAVFQETVISFADDLTKHKINGLAFAALGNQLNSDFSDIVEKLIDREQTKAIISGLLKDLAEQRGLKMLVEGGFDHTLPYVEAVINAPMRSNDFNITERTVPFYQMVVHGFVKYTGVPINLNPSRRDVLRLIEFGAYPLFVFSYDNAFELKHSNYGDFYSVHYQNWLNYAAELYHELNQLYHDVADQRMVSHEKLMDNVFATTYENGISIVVNYNPYPVTINGVIVGGEDYLKLEGLDRP